MIILLDRNGPPWRRRLAFWRYRNVKENKMKMTHILTFPTILKPQIFILKPQIFILKPQIFIWKPQIFIWKPQIFILKPQIFIWKPQIFIFFWNPRSSSWNPRSSSEKTPDLHLKPPDLHLKTPDLHFSEAKRSNLSARIKKQLNWARFVCLLSAEEDQGHKLWCTSTNLQEYDEWIGVEGPQTYGWIVRSKPSNLPLFLERNGIITKRTWHFQDMREISVALRNFHLEQWNNTFLLGHENASGFAKSTF